MKITFNVNDGNVIQLEDFKTSVAAETAKLVFNEDLPLGKSGYVSLEFMGPLNDQMKGFYKSKYIGYYNSFNT